MNVFMDDCRDLRNVYSTMTLDKEIDWVVVRRTEFVKELLRHDLVDDLSLDHDMGPCETGYALVLWMEEHGFWPKGKITVHSMNPVGKDAMLFVLARSGKI